MTLSLSDPAEAVRDRERARHCFAPATLARLTADQRAIFEHFVRGPDVTPDFALIHHAFEAHAAATPHAIAARHGDESITYAELDRAANRLAARLAHEGVSAGDCVALFVHRSIPMLAGMLAALKLGAAYVPQHVGVAPESQLLHVIGAAATRVILTLSHLRPLVPVPAGHTCIAIDDFLRLAPEGESDSRCGHATAQPGHITPSSACFVLFTSGTTGKPNGVRVTHRNLCNILLTDPGRLGMRPGMKVSQILNIAFDMAAWEILGCLANGATLLIRGKDIAETVQQANVVIATPSILATLDSRRCPLVRVVAVAGEPCPERLANDWSTGRTFFNSCGPTETTIVNTMQHYANDGRSLTIGKPTPNNTVYVLDSDLMPCAVGKTGEMWAGGECVTAGYIGNEALNRERYIPDPFLGGGRLMFRTRDLGRWTASGELEHLGRTDDQVKIRGFRVELDGVSAALETARTVERAVTLPVNGRDLIAFVTPHSANVDEALQCARERLPYYCVPARVIALDAFPLTSRGKIDKRALGDLAIRPSDEKTNPAARGKTAGEMPPPHCRRQRLLASPLLSHYNRLAALVLALNVLLFAYGITDGHWWRREGIAMGAIANAVVANLALAVLVRQQYVINLLFWTATRAPVTWPLSVRRTLGKVYHFGGLHAGGAIAATAWFLALFASMVWHRVHDLPGVPASLFAVSGALLALLAALVVMAQPAIRARYHNAFELTHRFAGWAALALFWVQTLLFVDAGRTATGTSHADALAGALFDSPSFWVLLAVTVSIALPWLRLRKVRVQVERLSSHAAIARFDHGVTPFAGSSTSISLSPLTEWHAFANIPAPGERGFRLIVSRAGDWTARFIDEAPSHVWVKGITTAGVANIETLFRRVVYVATGSGIGPVLPHLLAKKVPIRLIWATKSPRETYGDALVDEILAAQPDALIWDTDSDGKPDLLRLAYAAREQFDAEAVICIANRKLTERVVTGMESRGFAAYGAIWDS